MNNYQPSLDSVFHALSDPTRRAIVQRLGQGSASVSELAVPFKMALPSFMKHVGVLEASGLIATRKAGRVRTCTINQERFRTIDTWLDEQRALWQGRTNRLADYVETLAAKESDLD
ncbi:MAG: metalloregulator ArsR/SmtB family transcription factor [Pseudomonadota bacterium]